MSSRRLALVCGLVLSSLSVANAQDNEILTQLYGTGVHAFYAGDFRTAHADLSSVIERGTKDPRAYYFRAMAYLKLGRPDEAKADMAEGAKLESADIDGAFNVGRALERIQGRGRLTLEKYRLEARLAAHARQQQADRQKYETVRSREKAVLRDRVNVPLDGGPATVVAPPETREEVTPATAELPVDEPALPGDEPAKTPAANADPFGDDPATEKPADTPTAEDPFGAPADAPAADDPLFGDAAPAEKPAAAPAADDPFGGAAPTEKPAAAPVDDDPFGGAAPSAEKPAEDDPFGTDAPAADEPEMKKEDAPAADDPFGGAAPAEKPADAPADDPFGGEAPAEKPADAPAVDAPADDDPFGNDAPAADEPEMKKEDAPADDDPFGAAPAEKPADAPAADTPADEKPAEDDPFAADAPATDAPTADEKPAEDDPFATEAEDEKPADTKPAAEPAEDDDPFN